MSDDNCLDAASPEGPVKLVRCHGMGGNQAWVFSDDVSARILVSISGRFSDLLVVYKNMSSIFLILLLKVTLLATVQSYFLLSFL